MTKKQRIATFIIPFFGFVFTLLAVNGYQYFRMQNDFSAKILLKTSEIEMRELQIFFSSIEGKLELARDWGINDVLLDDDIVNLNKKLIPLVQQPIDGIVIANAQGKEFFLYRNKDNYITRSSTSENGVALSTYQEWLADNTVSRSWQDRLDYDPRTRPWFIKPQVGKQVHWTGVYTFFHSGELGVTASIAWPQNSTEDNYIVMGMDIPLLPLTKILAARKTDQPGVLFLVKEDGDSLILREGRDTSEIGKQVSDHDLDIIIAKLVDEWQQNGRVADEFFRIKGGKQHWLGVFQKIRQPDGVFWLGLTAPERIISDTQGESFFSFDLAELAIAVAGGLGVLGFFYITGVYRRQPMEPMSPGRRITGYLQTGENEKIEFKSTLRMNLRTGKNGKEIEFAWLKGVVAFLNSEGGALLVGVDDSGEICGLDADQFDNNDKILLHVKNLVNQHIGAEFSGFLETSLVDLDSRLVILIECKKVTGAVFLKIGKNEEFYIRSGPSSVKLSPSQIVNYIQKKQDVG